MGLNQKPYMVSSRLLALILVTQYFTFYIKNMYRAKLK